MSQGKGGKTTIFPEEKITAGRARATRIGTAMLHWLAPEVGLGLRGDGTVSPKDGSVASN
jgi:hypothetical protein